VVGAQLKNPVGDLPAGTPIDYEGVGTMSKSKNNGVDPQSLIDTFGADTARLYTMFTAPPEATLEWNDSAVEGSFRFLRRVWNFAVKHEAAIRAGAQGATDIAYSDAAKALRFDIHTVLRQANFDYERMQYNTVVSAVMKMLNTLEAATLTSTAADQQALADCFSVMLRVLYPACPHITCALWDSLGYTAHANGTALLDAPWPEVDESALVQDEVELVLQVNGKLRGAVRVSATASKAEIEAAAVACDAFVRQANGATPKKVIVVPGRLVNIVV